MGDGRFTMIVKLVRSYLHIYMKGAECTCIPLCHVDLASVLCYTDVFVLIQRRACADFLTAATRPVSKADKLIDVRSCPT
jgi:hypothetical protein